MARVDRLSTTESEVGSVACQRPARKWSQFVLRVGEVAVVGQTMYLKASISDLVIAWPKAAQKISKHSKVGHDLVEA
ncbi:hypothetical protein KCU62_g408, partial [Aureobasidium sp. EXF-3399]